MIRKVNNLPPASMPDLNHLLMVAYKTVNPPAPVDLTTRCRFDLFVRVRPGNLTNFRDQQRTWCYRGDKYTNEEHKMLRNLLNLVKSKLQIYDRVILYDHSYQGEENIVLKIIDDNIQVNAITKYSLMLLNYPLAEWMKVSI